MMLYEMERDDHAEEGRGEDTEHGFGTIQQNGRGENKDEGITLLNPRTRSYEFRAKGNGMRKK